MKETPKIVFSRTLDSVKWDSTLVKQNVAEVMREEKQHEGKDMVLFAGANIADTFIRHNLIDEYRLIINPVALGKGTPLFKQRNTPLNLQLNHIQSFHCGNTLLYYKPAR